jgi:membrane associated rhomboid family serine protease
LNFFPMPLGVAAITYMLLNFFLAHSRSHYFSGMHTAYELHITGFLTGIVLGILWNRDWKKNLLICIVSFIGFYLILGLIIYFIRHF